MKLLIYWLNEVLWGKKKRNSRLDGRFREIPMYLVEFIGAFTTDVEPQSTFHSHKYLQAITDLENS